MPYWNVTVVDAPLLLTVPLSVAPVCPIAVAAVVATIGPGTLPIVKFTFEMSKKMLVAHATFTRAVEVVTFGSVTDCEPSLGVAAASTVGNVLPPSVDSRMSTFAQLTGGLAVLATFHVTVCVLALPHVTAVLGEVTWKGPAAVVTLNEMAPHATPPPPTRLSRTVMRKLSARVTLGRTSPFSVVLASRAASRGNVRVAEAVAFHDRKNGAAVATLGGPAVTLRSYSSQL